jgi:lauroyl/myristoyl acyltransferase
MAPRSRRFSVCAALAERVLAPLHGVLRAAPDPLRPSIDQSLLFLLEALDARRAAYDPALELVGFEHMAAAARSGQGVLLAGLHRSLNHLQPRVLHDADIATLVVSHRQRLISGTLRPADVLSPLSASFMLDARRRLRAGGVLAAMLDYAPAGKNVRRIPTAHGPHAFDSSLIRLAVLCGAEVVFESTRYDPGRRRITVTYGAPAADDRSSAEGVIQAFTDFWASRLNGEAPTG